jgi:hypothetical protein
MTTTYENNKLSLLSCIPNDASNIIKDFIVETRLSLPLKIKPRHDFYFIVSNYKEGYQVNKIVNEKQIRNGHFIWTSDEKEIYITDYKNYYKKKYPVYIDDKDDLVNYLYIHFFNEYYSDDDYDDDSISVTVKIGDLNCPTNINTFKKTMFRFIPLIGKVYKKTM